MPIVSKAGHPCGPRAASTPTTMRALSSQARQRVPLAGQLSLSSRPILLSPPRFLFVVLNSCQPPPQRLSSAYLKGVVVKTEGVLKSIVLWHRFSSISTVRSLPASLSGAAVACSGKIGEVCCASSPASSHSAGCRHIMRCSQANVVY